MNKEHINSKVSIALSKKVQTTISTDSVDISISFKGEIKRNDFRILNTYAPGSTQLIRIPTNKIIELVQLGEVLFADLYVQPKEELTTGTLDLATNLSNVSHHTFPFITGEGVQISIKENKVDTIDLDYIGRYFNSGMNSDIFSPHASIMATTIAGAGNTSSYSKGVAHKSAITSSNFASLLPDPDAVFEQYSITVQNHSYGTVIQNYYGTEARAYDISAVNNSNLLHVFSSGNSGTAKGTGNYSEITGFANLTGNFKMSKNSLIIGAIDSFYNVSIASSKGPAYDGRIKPELVAFGEDGSSGAAAMASGSAALIQQAYRLKTGSMPSSAISKAVLINSATDIGIKGIDYAAGFGNLNTYAAVKTIQEDRVFENTLLSNEVRSFSIQVPHNAAQLKVTLVWTDPAAAVNATKALVNDLNLSVLTPGSSIVLPWVLNHSPELNSLLSPAERKIDTLNTIEQVTIDNPIAGVYTIRVAAGVLLNNVQRFALAYQVDTLQTLFWSFPTASDNIEAGTSNIIRWQTNTSGEAVLQYSTDKTIWKTIASLPDVRAGYYKWQAPDTSTTAWLRLQTGTLSLISDTFVISSIPRVDVGFNCTDSFLLYWNKQPAAHYQLFDLKDKYLSPLVQVNDTFYLLKKALSPAQYYSVAPVVNNKVGLRSTIVNYASSGVDCYFKSFFLQTQTGNSASLFSSIGSNYGVTAIALQKLQNNTYTTIQTIAQPKGTEYLFLDPSLQRGVNQYRTALQLSNGQTIYSSVATAYHFANEEVILYPNPARQQQPIHILTSRAGRTTIKIFNSAGALINEIRLRELLQQIPPLRLNRGLYFIKVINEEEGTSSSQKLVVQ